MENFKDIELETVARLVYPRRQQISLLQMLGSKRFKEYFAEEKFCIALTPGMKPLHGKMSFFRSEFLFHIKQADCGILNGQLLLLVFSIDEVDYCVQVASGQIFREYFVLQPIQARYHKRYLIKAPALICAVSEKETEAIVGGQSVIRRIRSDDQDDLGVRYFVREMLVDQTGNASLYYPGTNHHMIAAQLQDLSQGGCAFILQNIDEKTFRKPKIIYFEVTLMMGRLIGNMGCFAVKKAVARQGANTLLRCAFFEVLPISTATIKDASENFELLFDSEVKQVTVNGKGFAVRDTLKLSLPFGPNTFDIEWQGGGRERHRLMLNPTTPRKILIKAS